MDDMDIILADIRDQQLAIGNVLSEIHEVLIDIRAKLDDIQGTGTYNQLSDVCDKLDNIEEAVSALE